MYICFCTNTFAIDTFTVVFAMYIWFCTNTFAIDTFIAFVTNIFTILFYGKSHRLTVPRITMS